MFFMNFIQVLIFFSSRVDYNTQPIVFDEFVNSIFLQVFV